MNPQFVICTGDTCTFKTDISASVLLLELCKVLHSEKGLTMYLLNQTVTHLLAWRRQQLECYLIIISTLSMPKHLCWMGFCSTSQTPALCHLRYQGCESMLSAESFEDCSWPCSLKR